MEALEISEREQQILQAVVHTYITTAEPVGSRAVVKRFKLDLSPATVRNVMADLEDSGFLQQIHTSSGRVPTDRGYRYYVDYLMRVRDLSLAERTRIEQEMSDRLSDTDQILQQTSHLLALVTHHAGFAESPNEVDVFVQRLELLQIAPQRVAVLLVDNFGRVQTLTAMVDAPLAAGEIPVLNRFLNEHLQGVELENFKSVIERKMRQFLDEQRRLAERALQLLNLLPVGRTGQFYIEGANQLFEQPEFRDMAKAREVLGLLDERERIVSLVRAASQEGNAPGNAILIGLERTPTGLSDISVVASPYRLNGKTVGMIGVIGPRRMPYWRLTAIVNYTAGLVERVLHRVTS